MTAVNCPMCELRFRAKNERDWHLDNEHHPVHVHAPTAPPMAWARPPARGGRPDEAGDEVEAT